MQVGRQYAGGWRAFRITYRSQHLGHAAEVPTVGTALRSKKPNRCDNVDHEPGIHTEEQIDGSPSCSLLEGLVQSLVTRIRRAPNLVLERLVHIVLRVRFDDEEPRL